MSIEDARQTLIDERLVELKDVNTHRLDLLREMFHLVRLAEVKHGESGKVVVLGKKNKTEGEDEPDGSSEEQEQDEELELNEFLARFDLEKANAGSIMALDVDDLLIDNKAFLKTLALSPDVSDETYAGSDIEGRQQLGAMNSQLEEDEASEAEAGPSGLYQRRLLHKEDVESLEKHETRGEDSDEVQLEEDAMDMDVEDSFDRKESHSHYSSEEVEEASGDEVAIRNISREARSRSQTQSRRESSSPEIVDDDESDELDIISKASSSREVSLDRDARSSPRRGLSAPSATDHGEDEASDEDADGEDASPEPERSASQRAWNRRFLPDSPVPPGSREKSRSSSDLEDTSEMQRMTPAQNPPSRGISLPSSSIPSSMSTTRDESVNHSAQSLSEPLASTHIEDLLGLAREISQEFISRSSSPPLPKVQSLSKHLTPVSPRSSDVPSSSQHMISSRPTAMASSSPGASRKPLTPRPVDPSTIPPVKPPPEPIVVELTPSQSESPSYQFVDEPPPSVTIDEPTALEKRIRKAIEYSIPAMAILSAELNRRGKPQKSRKRDKDRERNGSDSGRKDEWVPMGMTKWSALLRANPVYKRIPRATKCINTKDWNIAMKELKLMRTFDRIEVLKRDGKWSFRQPKKQRVAAGLVKTHWDNLMDEMKWMQVDYREERKWKLAIAHGVALSAVEWHRADTYEERKRLGICTLWKKPNPLEAPDEVDMDVDDPLPSRLAESSGTRRFSKHASGKFQSSDDEGEQQMVSDALNLDSMLTEAFDNAQVLTEGPDADDTSPVRMKIEEVDIPDALRLARDQNQPERAMDDAQRKVPILGSTKLEIDESWRALKDTSFDPTMDSQPVSSGPSHDATPANRAGWTADQVKELRTSLLSLSDEGLFMTISDVVPVPDEMLSQPAEAEGEIQPHDYGFATALPELQPYSMADVVTSAEAAAGSADGRKKSDKKADRDDPTKRVEETTYTKLYPANQFMRTKPVLVSALQPAKKWRKGTWVDLDESPVVSDVDTPPTAKAESSCSLFEGRKATVPLQPPITLPSFSKLPPRTANKPPSIPWSALEDDLLKSLAERYLSNWRLVADALNSSRIRTCVDFRTPQECFERWTTKWGLPRALSNNSNNHIAPPEETTTVSTSAAPESTPPPRTPVAASPQMTTRGIKRLANSAAQSALNLTVATGAITVESRKRKRHTIISEYIRKITQKRDKEKKAANVKRLTGPVHDTHHQFGTKTRYTPLELSHLKAEKDKRDHEMMLAQRRQVEEVRKQRLLAQQQAHQQQAQQAQQQQAGQHSTAVAQNAAQIRPQVGISQQHQHRSPLSPQLIQQAQQARALAHAQQQQQAAGQSQLGLAQMQGQLANAGMNGQAQLQTAYANRGGGASSPVTQQSSPSRPTGTPGTNGVAGFPRPASAQRGVAMQVAQVLPMAGTQVTIPGNPIARTNSTMARANYNLSAYFSGALTDQHLAQMIMQQQHQQQQPPQPLQPLQQQTQNQPPSNHQGYPSPNT